MDISSGIWKPICLHYAVLYRHKSYSFESDV